MTVPEYLRELAKLNNYLDVEDSGLLREIAERYVKMEEAMAWAHSVLVMAEDRNQLRVGANMSKFSETLAAARAPLGEKGQDDD